MLKKYLIWLLFLVNAAITAWLNVSVSPIALRYSSIILLSLTLQYALFTTIKENRFARSIAPALFTFIWGFAIFNGYVYYDEIGRWPSPQLSSWFSTPINDHFHPIMYLIWFIQYDLLFGSYFFISFTFYLFAIISIFCVGTFINNFVKQQSSVAQSAIIITGSVPLHSWMFWYWKGCGDAPMLAFLFFSICLAIIARCNGHIRLVEAIFFIVFYFLGTFSSSAITLGFIFFSVIPLLDIRYRNKNTFIVLLLCFTISIIYWFLRSQLVASTLRWELLPSFLSGLSGVLFCYIYNQKILIAPLIIIICLSVYSFFKEKNNLKVLFLLGLCIFFIGSLQLVGGRGLTFEYRTNLQQYHMFFPFFGLSLMISLGICKLVSFFRMDLLKIMCYISLFTAALVVFIFNEQIARKSDDVRLTRAKFFEDLIRLEAYEIPNLRFTNSPYVEKFDWCPIALLKNADQKQYGWSSIVDLKRISFLSGRSLRISENDSAEIADPVKSFVAKWF